MGGGCREPRFLDLLLVGGELSVSRAGCFIPEERAPGTHWIGCCQMLLTTMKIGRSRWTGHIIRMLDDNTIKKSLS
jgi:hypothetical protein